MAMLTRRQFCTRVACSKSERDELITKLNAMMGDPTLAIKEKSGRIRWKFDAACLKAGYNPSDYPPFKSAPRGHKANIEWPCVVRVFKMLHNSNEVYPNKDERKEIRDKACKYAVPRFERTAGTIRYNIEVLKTVFSSHQRAAIERYIEVELTRRDFPRVVSDKTAVYCSMSPETTPTSAFNQGVFFARQYNGCPILVDEVDPEENSTRYQLAEIMKRMATKDLDKLVVSSQNFMEEKSRDLFTVFSASCDVVIHINGGGPKMSTKRQRTEKKSL